MARAVNRFLLLDGMRGVAAIAVVGFHFGRRADLPHLFPRGYLAVDFFFVLSGFVLAHAYGERLQARLSPRYFLTLRAVRLLPLLMPGAIVGAVIEFWRPHVGNQTQHMLEAGLAAVLGMFVIPLPVYTSMQADIFPLNGPVWSLWFEMVANVIFLFVCRRSNGKVLAIVLIAVGGSFLTLDAMWAGAVDGGAQVSDWPAGLPRVLFSFFTGVLLQSAKSPAAIVPRWLYPLALLGVLAIPADDSLPSAFVDLIVVFVVFPIMVWLGSGASIPRSSAGLCKLSGDLSYPLYAVHYPLIRGVCFILATHPSSPAARTLAAAITIVALCAGSWVLLQLYDKPARRILSRLVGLTPDSKRQQTSGLKPKTQTG